MSGIAPEVEHGFVVVRRDGRLLMRDLYRDRKTAELIVKATIDGFSVLPARRVSSMRQVNGTILAKRVEFIIDRGAA